MPARSRPAAHSYSRSSGVIFMLINTLCWGAALAISKFAVESTSSFFFLLYRFGFAALFSLPILIPLWRKHRPTGKNLLEILGLELIGTTLALGLLYWGLQLTTSLEASLLTMTIPIFVTIGGIMFLQEKEDGHEWMGLGLALAGTLILTIEPLLSGRTNGQLFTSLEGNTFIIVSNVAAAAYYLLAKKRYAKYPKFLVTGISFWIGAASFLLLALFMSGTELLPTIQRDLATPAVLWPSLYMATFGSIIGLTMYIKGQNAMEASEASLFTYLHPAVSVPLAFLLHQEMPTWLMLLALVVIGAGVSTAELPRWRKSIRHKKRAYSTRE